MKITNANCITAAHWGSVGSVVGVFVGVITTRINLDIWAAEPALGFILGTVIGTVAGFVVSSGIMRRMGPPPVVLGGDQG